MTAAIGKHAILDVWGADPYVLRDDQACRDALVRACRESGAHVRRALADRIDPGVTVIAILSESSATLHTYPEHGIWYADLFTCGNAEPTAGALSLLNALGGNPTLRTIQRGDNA